MRSPRSISISLTSVTLFAAVAITFPLRAQEEAKDDSAPAPEPPELVGKPLKLDISRRSLKNFLTDEVALIPYQNADGETKALQDTFMIGAVKSTHAAFWDPASCRLLGALNLAESTAPAATPDEEQEPPSPYTLLAAGSHPLNGSKGTFESPRYFGFRLVSGRPEFLYTFGRLQIEEQVWLEDDGLVLKQRYLVKGAKSGFQITVPSQWKERCEASTGEWKKNRLTVPADAEEPLTLTYRLAAVKTESPEED